MKRLLGFSVAALISSAAAGHAADHHQPIAYTPDRPQISREDDAEVLSHGRQQSRMLDINMTPPPKIFAPLGPVGYRPSASWLPGPIPNDIGRGEPHRRLHV